MRVKQFSLMVLVALGILSFSCDDDSDNTSSDISTDNVFVMPIRKLKSGQDLEDFKAKRDAYVALLEAEDGTIADREIQPFFEFTGSGLALDSVFVGLTSFKDFQTFEQIGENTSGNVANDFFATFDFLGFEVLQPLDESETVDLSELAVLGSNQVWEIAVRDLSQYPNFNQQDYETKRDAYLDVLGAQNASIREIQWKSISNPNVVVGMTIYTNASDYQSLNQSQDFINDYLATNFLQDYPINVYGAIHNVLK